MTFINNVENRLKIEECKIGYISNGFQNHDIFDMIKIITKLGFNGLGLTLDVCHYNPFKDSERLLKRIKRNLKENSIETVIETGARFLLNPWEKHEPTLVSNGEKDRTKRIEFLKKAVDTAEFLDANVVTIFSGKINENVLREEAFGWLTNGVSEITEYAKMKNIKIGFEPEPQMLIETIGQYSLLRKEINYDNFGLTLDIGHVQCSEDQSIHDCIISHQNEIFNIHLTDIKNKKHIHLPLGEGDINFLDVFKALKEIKYANLVNLELSRNSHNAPIVANQSRIFIKEIFKRIEVTE